MPHFRETYEYSELGAMYAQANKDVVRNDCRIERDKIEALCTKMRQGSPDISTQDCLTAYIVTVLNRCIQPPILNITNAASVMFAFESPTPVLIWWIPSTEPYLNPWQIHKSLEMRFT